MFFLTLNLKGMPATFLLLFFSHCQSSGERKRNKEMSSNVLVFLQIVERTKLAVFYFLECFSHLIGFIINIYILSTNRNKYNMHCCRMSRFNINVLGVSSAACRSLDVVLAFRDIVVSIFIFAVAM